jgi:hypothetical protein
MPINTSTAAVGGVALETILHCPECGHAAAETMPTDACVFFYDCARCGARLRPRPGDCCVFCSYGSVPCPPVQLAACGCRE